MTYTPLRYKAKKPVAKILAIILIIFLLILTLPLPLPFTTTLQSNGLRPARGQIGSIDSVWLSGTWSTTSGGFSALAIVSADGTVAYNGTTGVGTFAFFASNPPYTVVVYSSQPVTVVISGTAWGPLLPIGLP